MGITAAPRLALASFLALVGLASVGVGSVAADRLLPGIAFQTCVGASETKTLSTSLMRYDSGASFSNGQTVKFKILWIEQPGNGSLTAKFTDASIVLPGNWNSLTAGTYGGAAGALSSDTVTLSVTFAATQSFTDGGRIRIIMDGKLENIDIPTLTGVCAATTGATVEGPPFLLASAVSDSGPLPAIVAVVIGGALGAGAGYLLRGRRFGRLLVPPAATVLLVGLLAGVVIALPLALNLGGRTGETAVGSPAATVATSPSGTGAASEVPSREPSGSIEPSGSVEPSASVEPSLPPPTPTAAPAAPTATPPPPPPVFATPDYFFALDPGELAAAGFGLDPLVNDLAPDPSTLTITNVSQLTVPGYYTGSAGSTVSVGTIAIVDGGRRLSWTDTVCASHGNLCANLPALSFTYTISDGTKTATGRSWVKFDRPWLIPFGFDPNTLLVPPAIAVEIPANWPMQITNAVSVPGALPTIRLTTVFPCPSDTTKMCTMTADAVTSGSSSAGLLDPTAGAVKGVLVVGQPVPDGQNYAITGSLAYGTASLCTTVNFVVPGATTTYRINSGCYDGSVTVNAPGSVYSAYGDYRHVPIYNSMIVEMFNLSKPLFFYG